MVLNSNAGISLPSIEGINARGGTSKTTKVDSNHYVGLLTISNLEDKELDVAKIKWHIDSIHNPNIKSKIKGDWGLEI
jgi:hypothetical protein